MPTPGTVQEAVKGVYYPPDKFNRYITKAHATVVDLISEDGIDGLVGVEYEPDMAKSREGIIGYAGVTLKPLNGDAFKAKACSIYWNNTPLFDHSNGLQNFTDIDIEHRQNIFHNPPGLTNSKVSAPAERLWGPEGGGTSHYKHYKILNKECSKIVVAIKVAGLGKVDRYIGDPNDPNDNYGELLDSGVSMAFWIRAIHASAEGQFQARASTHIAGNFSNPYTRDITIDLPLTRARADAINPELGYGDFLGWELQIIRSTEEPRSPDVKNQTFVESITEYISDTLMAPQSYIVRSSFGAENFSSIPDRSYDMRLQKVRIPSNYDPITKTYYGVWNGTFSEESSQATQKYGNKCTNWENQTGCTHIATGRTPGLYWTDNPAWCFYDLLTNKRYGLGKYLDNVTVDKWTLYEVAQYCDELVSDGFGGLEPRFSCNILIQSREDAFQVLNDMASIFRALVYYSSGTVYAVQDSLKDAVFQFNNANVENGDFTYTTTSARVRHTVAVVRYNDKTNFYKPAVEYIDDSDGIRKYGIKEKEISAFGCTSRGQAIRLGKWILSTEKRETETVAFVAGMEGALVRPGDVFLISDTHRLINRRGGRLNSFAVSSPNFTIALDGKLNTLDANRDYTLTLSTPSFFYDPAQVELSSSAEAQHIRNTHIQRFTMRHSMVTYENSDGVSEITIPISNRTNCEDPSDCDLDTTHSATPEKMSWSILGSGIDNDAATIQERLNQDKRYRAINIAERNPGKFEISGAEYDEDKYKEVDTALTYTNSINFTIPLGPASLTINSPAESLPGTTYTKVIKYTITKNATSTNGLAYYAVFVKKGSDFGGGVPDKIYLTDKIYSINNPTGAFVPSVQDNYYFRVYSVNSLNEYSTTYKSGNIQSAQVGVVMPIRDVIIKSLRLTDNTIENASALSDPFGGTSNQVDAYDTANPQLEWETKIPAVQGINISFNFKYRIRMYEGQDGNEIELPSSYKQYLPLASDLENTTFEWPLTLNAELTKGLITQNGERVIDPNGTIDLTEIKRGYTIKVDAVDENGNHSSDGANANGYDKLWIDNPRPVKPDAGCTAANQNPCIQAFIDMNNEIKIYNMTRPADAQAVYIIAAKKGPGTAAKPHAFKYSNYLDDPNDTEYAFHVVKISDIRNTDPVFIVDPSFKTDDLTEAYVRIAYVDDFDVEVLKLAVAEYGDEETSSYDIRKLFAGRISGAAEATKVTPEIIDLIGEGWKSWIKIDVEGNWYGMGIKCIENITTNFENYKGYLPFYCTRKAPVIEYFQQWAHRNLTGAAARPDWIGVGTYGNGIDLYTASCMYYIPPAGWSNPPIGPAGSNLTHTAEYNKKGGYVGNTLITYNDPADGSTPAGPYHNEKFSKGFRRYRVWFEKPKAVDNYWVVGMNANEKAYFDSDLLKEIGSIVQPDAEDWDTPYEENMLGGALEVLEKARHGNSHELYIGGSDAYFNYHPAGFVQGFGGLAKTQDYFEVHMGHMIDNSYLKEAVFFVMASTQNVKTPGNPSCT